jgi:predicted short-subunit dehydrogenase-like oxidoreductase (DUF2520 family)
MTSIEIEPGINARFPNRSADFSEGFEVGVLATALVHAKGDLTRAVSARAVAQARSLAEGLGFEALQIRADADDTLFVFRKKKRRAKLQLVAAREA